MDILTDEDRDLLDRDAERPEAYDEPRECRWHADQILDAEGVCPLCLAEPCPHCQGVPIGRTWQGFAYCFRRGWQEIA